MMPCGPTIPLAMRICGGTSPILPAPLCGILPAMIVDWAVCIRTHARKRRIRQETERLSSAALNRPLNEIAADLSGLALAVQDNGPTYGVRSLGNAALSALEQVNKAYKAGGKLIGVPTGLIDLDAILGGLAPSDLTIPGGRPPWARRRLGSTSPSTPRRQDTGSHSSAWKCPASNWPCASSQA